MVEKNMNYLLDRVDEHTRVRAFDDAHMIDCAIDNVDVPVTHVLIPVSLWVKKVSNARHAPARAPFWHKFTVEVKIPR
jgi:hypothetical protein